jgi:hypothetical protein
MLGFGLFSVVDHFPKELTRTTAGFYGELLEQVEAAETLGGRSFWVAKHHFHEYGGICPPYSLCSSSSSPHRSPVFKSAMTPIRRGGASGESASLRQSSA